MKSTLMTTVRMLTDITDFQIQFCLGIIVAIISFTLVEKNY